MGGMSTRNEIKARLGILAEPKVAMTRPNAKAKFDSLAKFKAKVVQLVTMLGFKPDEITGNSEMVHVLFMDKPGQADRLAIALRRNLAQVGVPASAITTHEHRYADDDTTYGGVWVDVRALANAKSRASRPGAKAKMGRAEQVLRDGSVYLDFRAAKEWLGNATDAELRYIVQDARAAAIASPDGKKWNYYRDLEIEASQMLKKRMLSKATASRPGAKSTHAAPAQKPGRKVMAESDPAVSAKIRKLMAEGKPQKQAVAIALDMKRRGEI
jgi:hypothetical protein